jgi:hypothetical protein
VRSTSSRASLHTAILRASTTSSVLRWCFMAHPRTLLGRTSRMKAG